MNSVLKYRTFESLLSDCMVDFKKYHAAGQIDADELIKVARRCNFDLGLRIYQTKEIILDVEKGRTKLPDNFYVLNFGLLLGKFKIKNYYPQGTQVEERIIKGASPVYKADPFANKVDFCTDGYVPEDDCDPCTECPGSCHINCKGDTYQLVQTLKSETREWTEIYPLRMLDDTEDFNSVCPGKYWEYPNSAIVKDGWLYTSFDHGQVYINYESQMEDEDGNLLVPDHEMLNEFYEYAIKQRIMENLIINDEELNANKLTLIETRYRIARKNALSYVNTPNFKELRSLIQMNRNAMMSKYYDMFSERYNRKR